CVQLSLRDSNEIDGVPGVETPGCSRDVPPGRRSSNLRKAPTLASKLSTLFSVGLTAASLLMFCPASAHAQGGVPIWTNRYDGPGNHSDNPTAIAMDSVGNVFVTGNSWNGTDHDYATIAYSNSGVPLCGPIATMVAPRPLRWTATATSS